MVAIRKTLLLLAVVALTAAVASAVTAPFTCSGATAVTPLLRGESHADAVGDVVVTCGGGLPTVHGELVPNVNVKIWLNTNVTSKLLYSSGNWNEAFLIIDEPVPANQRVQQGPMFLQGVGAEPGIRYADPDHGANLGQTVKNVFVGSAVTGQPNAVEWLGVPVDPPGTQTLRIIRITNIRADAAFLAGFSGLIPSQVYMSISLSSTSTIPISFNQQMPVGFVQDGMTFDVVKGSGKLLQCMSEPKADGICDYDVLIRYKENFATAFKYKGSPVSTINTFDWDNESLWQPQGGYNGAGWATYGTRLLARFASVPAGVKLRVYRTPKTAECDDDDDDVSTLGAWLAKDANSTGHGGTLDSSAGWTEITVDSSGNASATWEVAEILQENFYDEVYFAIDVYYTSNTTAGEPGLGTATVRGTYAPLDDFNTAARDYAATTSGHAVPRFRDDSTAINILTVNACQTALLWPYVTNGAGFDTGMVISNTSKDPFSTGNQKGKCTIYYYGQTAMNGPAPAPDTTLEEIPAGGYAIWTLSNGGEIRQANVAPTPNTIAAASTFEGYVIAVCAFQYAHGYAFISDLGAQRLAQGYIALILDEALGSRTGFSSEALNQ